MPSRSPAGTGRSSASSSSSTPMTAKCRLAGGGRRRHQRLDGARSDAGDGGKALRHDPGATRRRVAVRQRQRLHRQGNPRLRRGSRPGPCFTPVQSPESNGIAEAFVKTFKRDYARINPLPDAGRCSGNSPGGSTTTTRTILIRGLECAPRGSSFELTQPSRLSGQTGATPVRVAACSEFAVRRSVCGHAFPWYTARPDTADHFESVHASSRLAFRPVCWTADKS